MDQRFVVDVLVPFRGLGFAVQYQAAAEKFRVQDFDFFVGRLAGVVDLPDLEHHGQVRVDTLDIPVSGHVHLEARAQLESHGLLNRQAPCYLFNLRVTALQGSAILLAASLGRNDVPQEKISAAA